MLWIVELKKKANAKRRILLSLRLNHDEIITCQQYGAVHLIQVNQPNWPLQSNLESYEINYNCSDNDYKLFSQMFI